MAKVGLVEGERCSPRGRGQSVYEYQEELVKLSLSQDHKYSDGFILPSFVPVICLVAAFHIAIIPGVMVVREKEKGFVT